MDDIYIRLIKSNFEVPQSLKLKFGDYGLTLRDIITSTRHRLYIASYVIYPNFPWLKEIEELIKRNRYLDLKILVDAEKIRETGIKETPLGEYIKPFKKGTLHMKVIISDGTRGILGSANLTHKGSEENYEIGVYTEGKMCSDLEELFLYLWSVS